MRLTNVLNTHVGGSSAARKLGTVFALHVIRSAYLRGRRRLGRAARDCHFATAEVGVAWGLWVERLANDAPSGAILVVKLRRRTCERDKCEEGESSGYDTHREQGSEGR